MALSWPRAPQWTQNEAETQAGRIERLKKGQSDRNLNGERIEVMKKERQRKTLEQPKPFTPGMSKGMVRQHAFEMFRDKLSHGKLTLEDWVLAEKDLLHEMETGAVLQS
jgi:hypothetical protein